MSMKISGMTETLKMLEALNKNTPTTLEEVVLAGVGVVTDTMRDEIENLKTSSTRPKTGKRYPTPEEVEGLKESLGYTPIQWSGETVDSKAGFDGYNTSSKTKKYPNGHANQMIANSINKGTSFLTAQPFINNTKKAAQSKTLEVMQKRLDIEIAKDV